MRRSLTCMELSETSRTYWSCPAFVDGGRVGDLGGPLEPRPISMFVTTSQAIHYPRGTDSQSHQPLSEFPLPMWVG